ncbi:MAG: DUF294 nucleotidyltransferase-like domain-containing protein [Kangiellaceae bacterium]|nr:DUF294 nucleotidyltransferase-like domain-containing protein [Kangiellaceae bacterium]
MEIEELEIYQYIKSCEPISKLNEAQQKSLALAIEIIYIKRGETILQPGKSNHGLYIIRSGAVERTETDGAVVAKFGEKDFFGQASIRRGGEITRKVTAIEDTLLYRFPSTMFLQLFESEPYFRFYFERNLKDIQSIDKDNKSPANILNQTHVKELLHDSTNKVDHKTSVAECAKLMQVSGSTSLLITQNEQVKGIVTDRAFCTKVVAESLSHESPVGLIMSDQLITIDEDASASEALLKMARFNIRHLPVTQGESVIGVLTATDLIHRQSNNPIYLVNQIYKANNIDSLKRHANQIPITLCRLVEHGMSSTDIGYTISSIGRAINQQMIKLAEQKLGAAPVNYAWVIAGSLARNDQTGKSDQDNLLILSDDYNSEVHGDYFSQLAKYVCDGLNQCGYVYCPGEVMASNTKWRQPLNQWKSYFNNWIASPEPKALMYASIFFDLRCIYGDHSLLQRLHQYIGQLVESNEMFLNYMAANALQHTPPLGLFRSFVLEDHGSEEKALNMKKRGVVPITDLARVYALACSAYPINTLDRLNAAHQAGTLSQAGLKDLRDAFEFLSDIRLQHQANQIRTGTSPDNYLPPEELSSLERRHLKDTFELIRTYQSALSARYQTGRFS